MWLKIPLNLSDTWRLNQSMPFTPMTKLTGCPNIVELMKESQRYCFANNFMFFISTGHCINGIKHIIDSVHIFFIKERNRFFFFKTKQNFCNLFLRDVHATIKLFISTHKFKC